MVKVGWPLFFLLIYVVSASAQKEANIWYFGDKAGLDFNSGKPVNLSNGLLSTREGCASICNSSGDLLFYTDGITVWDKDQASMPNGTGLWGDPSSSQSAIIVPLPQSNHIYYIFTIDAVGGSKGLAYSIVDMSLNAGLGALVSKNNPLLSYTYEKLSAVSDNANGFWVITRRPSSGEFYSYHLTETGVDITPVISTANNTMSLTNDQMVGYLKFSPNGKFLASANGSSGIIELFNFDTHSGKVTNLLCSMHYSYGYGIEFSPNSQKLYINNYGGDIYQYSIISDSANIPLTEKTVQARGNYGFGALQLGPDGKIYVAKENAFSLDVINFPDSSGAKCGYVKDAVSLSAKSLLGLPDFIQSFFNASINCVNLCEGSASLLNVVYNSTYDSISWNFGDSTSPINHARGDTVTHIFSKSGLYTVVCTIYNKKTKQNFTKEIKINPPLSVNLGPDRVLCNDTIKLNAYCDSCNYLWQDGSTNASLSAAGSGKYWVSVSRGNCTASDTVIIARFRELTFNMGHDTFLCEGDSFTLSPKVPGALSYLWQDSSTKVSYMVNKPGKYYVTISNKCGAVSDTINVKYYPSPSPRFADDTIVCGLPDFWLDATSAGAVYQWQDGSGSARYHVTDSGIYSVTVSNACRSASASVHVHINNVLTPMVMDTTVCDSITLGKAYNTDDQYSWQDGSAGAYFIADSSGTYFVRINGYCGAITDTFKITVEQCECPLYVPNSFTPNGDGRNETFHPSSCATRKYTMRIFNRWGEQLFESNDINTGWNGSFEGSIVPEGQYVYEISGAAKGRGFFKKAGVFYVLRPKQ